MSTDTPTATVVRGSCACGANTFEVTPGASMQRFYCHCLYCQQYAGKPYTGVTFVRAKNVVLHAEHATSTRFSAEQGQGHSRSEPCAGSAFEWASTAGNRRETA